MINLVNRSRSGCEDLHHAHHACHVQLRNDNCQALRASRRLRHWQSAVPIRTRILPGMQFFDAWRIAPTMLIDPLAYDDLESFDGELPPREKWELRAQADARTDAQLARDFFFCERLSASMVNILPDGPEPIVFVVEKSRRCSEAVSSLASGPRADSLPWFDSPLVQGASRLRYTDKAQMQRPGHTGRKALATKRCICKDARSRGEEGTGTWTPVKLSVSNVHIFVPIWMIPEPVRHVRLLASRDIQPKTKGWVEYKEGWFEIRRSGDTAESTLCGMQIHYGDQHIEQFPTDEWKLIERFAQEGLLKQEVWSSRLQWLSGNHRLCSLPGLRLSQQISPNGHQRGSACEKTTASSDCFFQWRTICDTTF